MSNQRDEHIAQTRRHIAECEERVALQEALIAGLVQRGRDTTEAQSLLRLFNDSLSLARNHLKMLLSMGG